MTEVQLQIEERIGRSLRSDWLAEHYERMFDAFRCEIRAIPGVRRVLEHLRQRNIPICVASQGPIWKMEVTLVAIELWPLLEGHIYSVDAVARSKTCSGMPPRSEGAAPGNCLLIEDSATGVRAAVATQGYGAGADGDALAEADASTIFSDMADLPALIWGTSP